MGERWLAKITRDAVMFSAGLVGVIYETVIRTGERPTLLALFGGMMGLPAFFRRDEKKKADEAETE
jgi:hypothetical protein